MKLYCSSCGHPHEYAAKKPNFCIECGTPFGAVANAPTPKRTTLQAAIEEDEKLDESNESVPEIDGLDIEIEGHNNVRGLTLEEVVNSGPEEPLRPVPRKSKRKMTKKAQDEFLKSWKEEAGTKRKE